MEAIGEMLQFLSLKGRPELKSAALDSILGLTASPEGLKILTHKTEIFNLLAGIAAEDSSEALRKDAALALINLSADAETAKKMVADTNLVVKLWQMIQDQIFPSSDPACMTLSNLTIDKLSCSDVWQSLQDHKVSLSMIVEALCQRKNEVEKQPRLHYLGPFLSNLSQLADVREIFVKEDCQLLQKLLAFTDYKQSSVRRGGVISCLRNCCFDTDIHEMLLNQLDLLPKLLLPLAGPTPEAFSEEEIEELPIDLQYLDDDKVIESDADIRKLLLEALLQLCATRKGREILRKQNTYLILRELHKVEKDETVLLACENVVDILIKKEEEEIGFDNYKALEVPENIQNDSI